MILASDARVTRRSEKVSASSSRFQHAQARLSGLIFIRVAGRIKLVLVVWWFEGISDQGKIEYKLMKVAPEAAWRHFFDLL